MEEKIDELYKKYLQEIIPIIFDKKNQKCNSNPDPIYISKISDRKNNCNIFWRDSEFCDGYRLVKGDYGYNYEDKDGNLLCSKWFNSANRFCNGFAKVYIDFGNYRLIDLNGEFFCDEYRSISVLNNKLIVVVKYSLDTHDYIFNYLNSDGNLFFNKWFDYASTFSEGFARVKKDNRWYFINENLEFLKDPKTNEPMYFDNIGRFSDGYSWVEKNGKYYYIDKNGNKVIDNLKYDIITDIKNNEKHNPEYLSDFHEGFALVKKDNKYIFIDKNGVRLGDISFDDAFEFQNGFACVNKNNKWNYIDKKGKTISDTWFDAVSDLKEGFISIKKDNKYNFIDTNGKIISDIWFNSTYNFQNGFACVKKDNKWNYIDTNGKLLSNTWFDTIYKFEDGKALVIDYNHFYRCNTIDSNGNLLFKDWYYIEKMDFLKNYLLVTYNSKYNLISKAGKFLFDIWYDKITSVDNSIVCIKLNGKYNIANINGEILCDEWFDDMPFFEQGYAPVMKKGKFNLIDKNGKLVLEKWADDFIYPQEFIYQYGHALLCEKNKDYIIDTHGRKTSENLKIGKTFKIFNGSFCVNDKNIECISIDLNGYTVKKSLFGYVCEKNGDKFRTKYKPIRIYDERYVLCQDKNKVILLDRKKNNVIFAKLSVDIEFDKDFIFDLNKSKVLFVYHNEILDITDYYIKNLIGKKEINIDYSVKIQSKDEFTFHNEDEINEELRKERDKQQKELEKRKQEEQVTKLENAKIIESREQENLVIKQKEAFEQLKNALEKLETLDTTNIPVKRIGVKNLFINVDDHREINPIYLSNGLLRYIDFSLESFENVKMDGIDFSGCNIHFDPQKVYQRNLRNCNLKKVYISPFMNFADVDIRGASFSDDDDPKTVDGFNASFRNAIYDETTTYNGKPFTEAFGECKNKPDIKVITKEE